MASSDALPVPRKNVAFRCVFPILDADGDLVTGAAGLDSEISKDQGAFADCTSEATEIATASGVYYLDLTSTEMNADCVAIIVKTSTSGAKTTVLVFYPEEAGDYRASVVSGGIAAAAFASGAIDAAALAADAGTEIGTAVWATTTRLLTAGTNIALAKGTGVTGFNDLSAAQVNAEVDTAISDSGLVASVADLPTNAELATALGTADDAVLAAVATVDTVVDAIKAVTDLLPDAGALTSLATAANLATVDTVVDAVKVQTDKFANLPVLTAGGTGGQGFGAP